MDTVQNHAMYLAGMPFSLTDPPAIHQLRFRLSHPSTIFPGQFLLVSLLWSTVTLCVLLSPTGERWFALCLPLSYGSKKSLFFSLFGSLLVRVSDDFQVPCVKNQKPEVLLVSFNLEQLVPWSFFDLHYLELYYRTVVL